MLQQCLEPFTDLFGDSLLSIFTKSIVYKAVVLGVLLYALAGRLSKESYIPWKFSIIIV